MLVKLENYGGICDSQASRDTFIYAASAYAKGLDDIINLLGEVVLRPRITQEEIDIARQTIGFELESLGMRPEQETLLTDMVHAVSDIHQNRRKNKLKITNLVDFPYVLFKKK